MVDPISDSGLCTKHLNVGPRPAGRNGGHGVNKARGPVTPRGGGGGGGGEVSE